jgi:hypothetical protein
LQALALRAGDGARRNLRHACDDGLDLVNVNGVGALGGGE